MKAGTAAFAGELAAGTVARRADVAGQMAEHNTAHQAKARATREQLTQATTTLKTEVASQMTGYATETSEARAAWREHLSPPPPKVKVAPPPKVKAAPTLPRVEVAPPPPRVEVALPPPAVKEVVPDDLTVIRGIGPSMETRLNECGVTTYAQLAGASRDVIREKLGDFGRLAKVDDWIARAKELI